MALHARPEAPSSEHEDVLAFWSLIPPGGARRSGGAGMQSSSTLESLCKRGWSVRKKVNEPFCVVFCFVFLGHLKIGKISVLRGRSAMERTLSHPRLLGFYDLVRLFVLWKIRKFVLNNMVCQILEPLFPFSSSLPWL